MFGQDQLLLASTSLFVEIVLLLDDARKLVAAVSNVEEWLFLTYLLLEYRVRIVNSHQVLPPFMENVPLIQRQPLKAESFTGRETVPSFDRFWHLL